MGVFNQLMNTRCRCPNEDRRTTQYFCLCALSYPWFNKFASSSSLTFIWIIPQHAVIAPRGDLMYSIRLIGLYASSTNITYVNFGYFPISFHFYRAVSSWRCFSHLILYIHVYIRRVKRKVEKPPQWQNQKLFSISFLGRGLFILSVLKPYYTALWEWAVYHHK